jgi:hypothetical protein
MNTLYIIIVNILWIIPIMDIPELEHHHYYWINTISKIQTFIIAHPYIEKTGLKDRRAAPHVHARREPTS